MTINKNQKETTAKGIKPRRTPKERLEFYFFKPEHIQTFISEHSLNMIFNKYGVSTDKQNKICKLLMGVRFERGIELTAITQKTSYKASSKINLFRLLTDFKILLNRTPMISEEDKTRHTGLVEFMILIETGRRETSKKIENDTFKRTSIKIQRNEKNLRIYTLLIKKLVPLINPIFLDKLEKLKPSPFKKATFKFVSAVINKAFPSVRFTPTQIKGRFHKSA